MGFLGLGFSFGTCATSGLRGYIGTPRADAERKKTPAPKPKPKRRRRAKRA